LAKANAFTKEKNELLELGGKTLQNALKTDSTALSFVKELMRGSGTKSKEMLSAFHGSSKDTIRAAMLKDIMDKSVTKKQYFDIETFINQVNKAPQLEATLGPHYKMVKGFYDAVKPAVQRSRLTPKENLGFGAPIVRATFGLLDKIGGKPSLKKALIRNGYLRAGELKDYMGNYITQRLIQAGVIVSTEGDEGHVFKIKGEEE
jgi:hypothetical protein